MTVSHPIQWSRWKWMGAAARRALHAAGEEVEGKPSAAKNPPSQRRAQAQWKRKSATHTRQHTHRRSGNTSDTCAAARPRRPHRTHSTGMERLGLTSGAGAGRSWPKPPRKRRAAGMHEH